MSPEQVRTRRSLIDRRTDIYSLGVTLYELLTLKRPFEGETSQEVLKSILLIEPIDPHKENERVPRDLSVICLKAMEKEPKKRYQAMIEFAKDLNCFLSGDVITAKPAGLSTLLWKRVKRNPVVSVAVSVAMLAIMIFAVVVPWVITKESQKREKLALNHAQELQNNYDEIMRLSDVKRLSNLEAEAEALWPAYPENTTRLEEWLIRAKEILGRLDVHQQILVSLRKDALPFDEAELNKDQETHPQWEAFQKLIASKSKLVERIASLESEISTVEGPTEDSGEEKSSSDPDKLKEKLASLEVQISLLENAVSERRAWVFEDTETQWQHDMVSGLVSGIEALANEEEGLLKSVQERLDFATTVEEKSIAEHQVAWDEAIASIADGGKCPQYKGLIIEPIVGLVPIDRDPGSGLWEFGHLQTGDIPKREADGKLLLTEETGLVFVLIPGGTFMMGAVKPSEDHPLGSPNVDPEAHPNEGPVHEVCLRPFFLSKYEMTQGQWLRFTGRNPSQYGPEEIIGGNQHNLLHPVEFVSWNDCSKVLSRLKLRLPTESEWEYATRAGTSTVFFTGDNKLSLQGAVNIADVCLQNEPRSRECEASLNDGYVVHAPVGTFLPNAFGLHDVHGNVWEWCQDIYKSSYKNTPVDSTVNNRSSSDRVGRSGSWTHNAFLCRSTNRSRDDEGSRSSSLGLRPAADLSE